MSERRSPAPQADPVRICRLRNELPDLLKPRSWQEAGAVYSHTHTFSLSTQGSSEGKSVLFIGGENGIKTDVVKGARNFGGVNG